jgi:hypothetical protein
MGITAKRLAQRERVHKAHPAAPVPVHKPFYTREEHQLALQELTKSYELKLAEASLSTPEGEATVQRLAELETENADVLKANEDLVARHDELEGHLRETRELHASSESQLSVASKRIAELEQLLEEATTPPAPTSEAAASGSESTAGDSSPKDTPPPSAPAAKIEKPKGKPKS